MHSHLFGVCEQDNILHIQKTAHVLFCEFFFISNLNHSVGFFVCEMQGGGVGNYLMNLIY